MKRVLLFVILAAVLCGAATAQAKPVGDMPMVDPSTCQAPDGSPDYYQAGQYYPYYAWYYYAWVYPNGYLKEYRVRWDDYTLVCEYQSVAGRLAWVRA